MFLTEQIINGDVKNLFKSSLAETVLLHDEIYRHTGALYCHYIVMEIHEQLYSNLMWKYPY